MLTIDEIATCRKDLFTFTKTVFGHRKGFDLKENWHQQVICDALEKTVTGQIRNLIINVPPRSGKTELAVVNYIAWCMGNFPDCEFIHSSFSARLATNNAFMARSVMQTDMYQSIFGRPNFLHDSNAKNDYRTKEGGVVYAAGAGGTITGYGAGKMRDYFGGAIIIDDPHKAAEAESEVMRKNIIDWFFSTIESRKNHPDTPIIVIMQRLHEEDLSGFLLAGGSGDNWEHVCIPAETDGASFWEEQFPIEELRRLKEASAYRYSGQYMQTPAPDAGGMFKTEAIQFVDAIPAGVTKWVRAWDLAATTDGDWTVGAKMGLLPDNRIVVADIVRIRATPDERDRALLNTASMDGINTTIDLPQDPAQAGKSQIQYLTRLLSGYSVRSSPESGDKVTRADPFASQLNVGNVLMMRAAWNKPLIDELRSFPFSKHKDHADALSRGFTSLVGNVPQTPATYMVNSL